MKRRNARCSFSQVQTGRTYTVKKLIAIMHWLQFCLLLYCYHISAILNNSKDKMQSLKFKISKLKAIVVISVEPHSQQPRSLMGTNVLYTHTQKQSFMQIRMQYWHSQHHFIKCNNLGTEKQGLHDLTHCRTLKSWFHKLCVEWWLQWAVVRRDMERQINGH